MRNYPKSYENFWDKLQSKNRAVKTKNGWEFIYRIENNEIYGEMEDGHSWYVGTIHDKEGLYCDMLSHNIIPRVEEY